MFDVGAGIAVAAFTLSMLGVAYKVGRIEQSKIGREEYEKHRRVCQAHSDETIGRIHSRIDQLFTLVKNGGNKSGG